MNIENHCFNATPPGQRDAVSCVTLSMALAAIEQARREEREAWRGRAAQWLHDRARAQECTNIEYPSHAASYPSWSAIVSHADQFAFELERELAAILARKP